MNYDFVSRTRSSLAAATEQDPYIALDIHHDADLNQIKTKFRKLTKLHHPDRNRTNPNYDPKNYASICAAYETLTDPVKRAQFERSNAASFNVLRSAATENARKVKQESRMMTESDLKQFNENFTKTRKMDPNDIGYGSEMITDRVSAAEALRGQRADIEAPVNVFGSSNVNRETFNNRFQTELQSKRKQRTQAIQERGLGEPEGWGGGSMLRVGDISVFDGVIVNRQHSDFSGSVTNLQFADYMAGFETITEQIPEDHEYLSAQGDVGKQFENRKTQAQPGIGHNLTYQQAEAKMFNQREKDLQQERLRNKEVVMRYRDQYVSQDLLPQTRTKRSDGEQQANRAMTDRTFSRFN